MAGKRSYHYTDEQIAEAMRLHGTQDAAAQALGMSRSGLQHRLRGLRPGAAENRTDRDDGRQQDSQDVLAEHVRRVRSKEEKLEEREAQYFQLLAHACRAFPPPDSFYRHPAKADRHEEVAVLNLSDWHADEIVRPDEIDHINAYSRDILTQRLELLVEKCVSIVNLHRRYADVRHLVVAALGDMTSGIIHEELERNADLTAVEQPALAGYLLACVVHELARHFETVELVTVIGNHGRLKKKPEAKRSYNSFDYQAYQIAGLYLRDVPNLRMDISRNVFFTKDILGWRFVFSHGHAVKGWAGIPFYGLRREYGNAMRRNTFRDTRDNLEARVLPVHYYCMGHFHQKGDLDEGVGQILLNGSTKGADEYGMFGGYISRPFQRFFGIHPEHGLTWNYAIWLDRENPRHPGRYSPDLPDIWSEADFSRILH